MISRNSNVGNVVSSLTFYKKIKTAFGIQLVNTDWTIIFIGNDLIDILLLQNAENLEFLLIGIGDNTCRNRTFNSMHTSRSRHDNAFDILDDISAETY